MVARFGITARQLAENLEWKKHDVEQDPARERIRQVYRENAKLYMRPTQKGREHLDETSPIWKSRYIRGKPVSLLEEEEFLYYHQAKKAEHLDVKFVFEKETDNDVVLRVLSDALLSEQPYRVKCGRAMYARLEPAAFHPSEEQMEDEDDDITRQGEVRVMGIAYSPDMNEASFGVLVDQDGAVIDYCRMVHFLKRTGGYGPQAQLKADSMNFFKKFVERRRPHVIGLCGEDLDAIRLRRDVEECLNKMVADGELTRAPPVYIMDNEAAKVYMLSKSAMEELSSVLARELINRVNEVGVDVNSFIACSERCFAQVAEKTDAYVEVLDGSRVHPETYEWARKMAVDALEVDDSADPTTALEEILQAPDRLKDLDLDAFAEELKRQGFGEKKATLYDISAELNHRYKDQRRPFVPLNDQELFTLLTKESKTTMEEEKRVCGVVTGVQFKKIPEDQRQAYISGQEHMGFGEKEATLYDISAELNHRYKDQRRPFVPLNDQELFTLLTKESKTTMEEEKRVCGVVTGVQFKKIPEDQRQAYISGQEHMIEPEKFSCLLSCRSSDLNKEPTVEHDQYWDYEAEKEDLEKDRSAKMQKGDLVIRPSAKSNNRLTISWKVTDGVVGNIDVEEHDKDDPSELGRRLTIL
ncbi:hypothetical protein OESDEN_00577 [Oesophagostomum dentatum]|uniref:Uncharacterized protein n=1 Tax=Oesophagostomum dentatum TaxID=61180 RepID=A0A0B1TQ83_OESDE|nr:hypothetical protein OESDEN_00577 [Oesophagostomum dentatum]